MAGGSALGWTARLAQESGLGAILRSGRDTKLLCLSRAVRMFAYGATFLILADFLSRLAVPDPRIGLFMTLTLLGDSALSALLTAVTDRAGRRRVLAAGALLMAASGAVFAASGSYWVLVAASVFGVVSPAGGEIGPFRAVEESVLAQLAHKEARSDVFAWYTLFGTAGAALGTVSCGWLVQLLRRVDSWTDLQAYRVVFAVYSGLGIVKLLIVLCLSQAVELDRSETRYQEVPREGDAEGPLADEEEEDGAHGPSPENTSSTPLLARPRVTLIGRLRSLFPYISPLSRSILYRLLLLFTLDSFASGMASPSWLTYFFTTVHSLPPSALGTLFLATNILAAASNLAALPLARRLGPPKTMVFTHLTSAVFLAAIPLPPAAGAAGTWLAMALLALRACTQSMDQAPRQAFLAAAVLPGERTAVLGVVNVVKSLAQAGGVGAAGGLAGAGLWVVDLGGAGLMKASYDLLMLWMFLGLKDREPDAEAPDQGQR